MSKISIAWLVALGLFIGILILLEVGRRIGERRLRRDPDGARAGTGAVEGAIFGLVGLLIAFTFSGAASRFDDRRELIVQETNAIGTAYLRLDLLPEGARETMQERFRRYLDARIEGYRKLPDVEAARVVLTQANAMQGEIWTAVLAAAHREGASPDALKLLLPALNDMFDITTTRTNATAIHPPMIIYGMLVILTLASALMAGYGMAGSKGRPWLHIFGFAIVMALAVYIIIDIEYPRLGLIRVEGFDQALMNLRAGMK
ncbi:DUF4239 domain-containing protein [uncultured Thiodictyon sp.]|jgi:hypothetical protein|uniref:bestrophin-like domain n=1 Tax=uncultured Thiodictyon sp. TaxID=1846217 RepID=UPI0025EF59D8|nr:DUF4239 domain-containing protein [uncultured Thiodictyon sp.]